LPTVLAAVDAKLLANVETDGVNLLPYLKGEEAGAPHEALFWRYGDQSAVRKGRWKLVKVGAQTAELYDLAADIGESHNLALERPKILEELEAAWKAWNSQMMAPRWVQPSAETKQSSKKKQRGG
jgi:arylsulfatase A-like enzyme